MAGWISAADLARMRSAQESAMDQSGYTYAPALTSDGKGGKLTGTPTAHGPYAMSVRANGVGVQGLVAQGVAAVMPFTIRTEHDAVVEAGYTVVVGGRTFIVKAVRKNLSAKTALELDCVEATR